MLSKTKPSNICQRFLKVCPGGKISPNLVTLSRGQNFNQGFIVKFLLGLIKFIKSSSWSVSNDSMQFYYLGHGAL